MKQNSKIWTEAFRNGAVCEWLCIGWNAWVIKNNFRNHWRKRKTRKESMNDMDGNKEGVDSLNDGSVKFILPNDKDFDDNKEQSRMRSPTENNHLRVVEGEVVSKEKANENDEDNEQL